jgi:alanine-synthesizing transaminase
MPNPINKSNRLNNLSYAIRGPVFEKAQQLEAMGQKIINLNIGNPAPFGFDVPDEIVHDMIMPNKLAFMV